MHERHCLDCSTKFSFDQKDLDFYSAVSPKIGDIKYPVILPERCEDCRERIRLAWRNDRSLYKRKCDLCSKQIISCYSKQFPAPVYCAPCWHGENWNIEDYSLDYDKNCNFFEQFQKLMQTVPHLALFNVNAHNSDYGNHTVDLKNCYLVFASGWNEDVQYATRTWKNKFCLDIIESGENELCYSIVNCHKCYDVKYALHCNTCISSYFLEDCVGCSDCFGSVNLRNAKHVFFNEQLSEKTYKEKLKELSLGSHQAILALQSKFKLHIENHPVRFAKLNNCQDCSGDMLTNSKNAINCYNLSEVEDCKHCELGVAPKRSYDCSGVSYGELCLGIVNHVTSSRTISGVITYYNDDAYYIYNCHSCRNILGCIGLKHKNHYILNKQYDEKKYNRIFGLIASEMIKNKTWGNMFPGYLSPFSYQETEAHTIDALTETQAKQLKHNYYDVETDSQNVSNFVKTADLADNIRDCSESLLDMPIKCEVSGKYFAINKAELGFYKTNNIPLPRRHSNQRYLDLVTKRNPRKLREGNCSGCNRQIKTNYPVSRKNVLCEECYYKLIY